MPQTYHCLLPTYTHTWLLKTITFPNLLSALNKIVVYCLWLVQGNIFAFLDGARTKIVYSSNRILEEIQIILAHLLGIKN